jgi:hypothetical protein
MALHDGEVKIEYTPHASVRKYIKMQQSQLKKKNYINISELYYFISQNSKALVISRFWWLI